MLRTENFESRTGLVEIITNPRGNEMNFDKKKFREKFEYLFKTSRLKAPVRFELVHN